MKSFQARGLPVWLALGMFVGVMCSSATPSVAQGEQAPSPAAPTDQNAPPSDWPRQIQSGGSTLLIYQPQHDRWEGNKLYGRAAVSISSAASPAPVYGVVWFTARTDVDKQAGTVTLDEFQITKSNLPKPAAGAPDYLEVLKQNLPTTARTIPLEQLEASLAITQAESKQKAEPVENPVPTILFSTTPAILVLVDGEPALRPVPDTNLLRVINTRALILLDQSSGHYYLYLADHWVEAAAISGPWSPAKNPPASLDKVKQDLSASQTVDLLDEPNPDVTDALSKGIEPAVYVSTGPAELIVTQGQPDLQPIPGTNLLWVRNSSSSIFMDVRDQEYYVLISGRWFRGPSLAGGNWSFVPAKSLPADFARIPETHPSADALPSVPGTPEAQQARIANSIPQTATVQRNAPAPALQYDGEPRFQEIAGSSLQYADNCPTPVIRVNSDTYYMCQNGVWFTGPTPTGPWVVATSVPAEIYAIPLSCPISYVRHVVIYRYTPDYVYCGYTPGYMGTCLSPYGTVVYGTGYYYRPWIGSYWFGFPITYGCGVAFDWTPGFGWSFGFGWGAGPLWWPWWGPWWGHWNGFRNHWGPGGWRRDVNVAHTNVYNRWDRNVVSHQNRFANRTTYTPRGARGTANNVFAGSDGKVYRRTPTGGWEQRNGNQWRSVTTPGGRGTELNREDTARTQAQQRTQTRQPYTDFPRPSNAAPERAPSTPRVAPSAPRMPAPAPEPRPAERSGGFGGFARRSPAGGGGGGGFRGGGGGGGGRGGGRR